MSQNSTFDLTPPLLLATDGSNSAVLAQQLIGPVAQLLSTADSDQPVLEIVTVQPRPPRRVKLPSLPRRSDSTPSQTEPSRPAEESPPLSEPGASPAQLHTQVQAELPAGLRINSYICQGRPTTEILNHAHRTQAGLIAVGCQGKGATEELFLGSVSAAIARYAPCHVLVARRLSSKSSSPELSSDKSSSDESSSEDAAPSWRHVLLVVSGSDATKQAIALTRQLIPIGIQQVTVLCVQPPLNTHYLFGAFATPTPSWQLTQSLQQAQKEQSEQMVQQAEAALQMPDLQPDLQPNLRVDTLVQISEPGPLICQIAQQRQVDMVIMGGDSSRRFAKGDRPLPGRHPRLTVTGDYVIHHSPCPVLLCRAARPSPSESTAPQAKVQASVTNEASVIGEASVTDGQR